MKSTVALSALLFSMFLWSCGGDGTPTAPTPTPTPVATSITLSATSLGFASLGETAQLSATVKDQNGATMSGASVTWSSSSASIVTVSSTGLVTAVADGTATITATSGSASGTASVTVTQGASSVTVSPTSVSFASLADTATLVATVKDAGGTVMSGATVTWTTSDASVATVSTAGLVTAVADGTATVTATFGVLAATTSVTVAQVAASVTLSPTTVSFASLGDTATLVATLKDANDSTMSGATVTWATSAASVATVSSAGLVTSVADGTATITATSGSLSATAEITVNQVGVAVDTITATWTEGAAATITGSGFSATPASNTVTVDGLTASITSASITELQITVPTSACKPSRVVDLVVTVASESATKTVGVKPKTVWSLSAGTILYTIGGECLHLAGGSGSEKYIIGVLSTSESATSLTPYTQTAIAGTTLAGDATPDFPVASEDVGYIEVPIIAFGDRAAAGPAPLQEGPIDSEEYRRSLAHAEAEARIWEAARQTEQDLDFIGTNPQAMAAAMEATIRRMPARSVGDTIPIRVRTSGNLCRDTTWAGYDGIAEDISAVVRYIGTSAIYLEDIGNPLSESFTTAEYADLDATFSGTTLPTIKNYFGDFVDSIPRWGVAGDTLGLDGEGRVGIVLTKEVNKRETLNGFVNGYDLFAKSYCNMSNQAEIFYGLAPDPSGIHERGEISKTDVLAMYPRLIGHEVTHILQRTQLWLRGGGSKARWEREGGATLSEQLSGNATLSHGGSGQNLGATEFLEGYNAEWYKNWAHDLRRYFGRGSDSTVVGAPEECTWLAKGDDNPGPCLGSNRAVYGVPATLLRFILDEYGPSYGGGEAALMRDLTKSSQIGYDNLVTTTGASSIGYLLTIFGATLWADGRIWDSLTSWDLRAIMDLWTGTNGKLQPYTSSDAEPTSSHSVRGGSTAYLEWSPPSSHSPTSLRIRTPDGNELPDEMSFWILRIQ